MNVTADLKTITSHTSVSLSRCYAYRTIYDYILNHNKISFFIENGLFFRVELKYNTSLYFSCGVSMMEDRTMCSSVRITSMFTGKFQLQVNMFVRVKFIFIQVSFFCQSFLPCDTEYFFPIRHSMPSNMASGR